MSDGLVFAGDFDGAIAAIEISTGQARWRVAASEPPSFPIMAPPVVQDDEVFVGSDTGALVALDVDDGTVVWRSAIGSGEAIRNAPLLLDDAVVVASAYTLVTVSAGAGDVRWQQEIPGGVLSLDLAEETVVLGSHDDAGDGSSLTGYALTNGNELWRLTNQSSLLSTPAMHDGMIYLGSVDSFSAVRLPG